jgi:hypothetical protein
LGHENIETLPSEVHVLQQIVLQLLQTVEDKDQLLARVQHQLAQLLHNRYGQKRERIDENQLFLFAAQIIAASQRARAATFNEESTADSLTSKEKKESEHRGHGRRPLPKTLERRRVVFDLEESQRQYQLCQTPMQRIGFEVAKGQRSFCEVTTAFCRLTLMPPTTRCSQILGGP